MDSFLAVTILFFITGLNTAVTQRCSNTNTAQNFAQQLLEGQTAGQEETCVPDPGMTEFGERLMTYEEVDLILQNSKISGFGKAIFTPGTTIPESERLGMERDPQADPTYGEVVPASVDSILRYVRPGKDDVFYDLGSGMGKVVFQAHLTTSVGKAVGVELFDA